MRSVLFFPDNKAGVQVCPISNGHVGIVSQNTDRIYADRHALAEIGLMRHNLQGTAFVDPSDPAELVKSLKTTGRISFGLYYQTDQWFNPETQNIEIIPDYYSTAWTQAGEDHFSTVTSGASKPERYPNHGQQLFDVSAGDYGYDGASQSFGLSNGTELKELTNSQVGILKNEFQLGDVSAISYRNGQQGLSFLHMPDFIGGRNSFYSYSGDSYIAYDSSLTHQQLISRENSTRTLDAGNSNFPNHADSIAYTRTQVQRAINTGGWWVDFMHWHSAYSANQLWFFDDFYAGVSAQIGSQDVWRAGYGEALEYFVMRESIDKIGSFFEGDSLRIFVRFNDVFGASSFNGIPTATPVLMPESPISLEVDLSGTPLAGQNIVCAEARSIRKVGGDTWIINFNLRDLSNGFRGLKVTGGGNPADYYNAATPVLSYLNGVVSADQPCKFVVWESSNGTGHEAIYRSVDFEQSIPVSVAQGYDATVGAITRSRTSAVIDI